MNRILVALDGSPRSPEVLSTALDMATKLGGKLVLFRAVGLPAGLPSDMWARSPEELVDVLRGRARTYLEDCAKGIPADRVASLRVDIGAPWQAVCDAAKDEKVDLIVIGSHGYAGLDRLLGTTAAKIVNHADRSVLVLRATK